MLAEPIEPAIITSNSVCTRVCIRVSAVPRRAAAVSHLYLELYSVTFTAGICMYLSRCNSAKDNNSRLHPSARKKHSLPAFAARVDIRMGVDRAR